MKVEIMVPLFKKGDRNNDRGVCSLMCSRVIVTCLAWWAEHLGLLDEN